jgi:hypothetical protein
MAHRAIAAGELVPADLFAMMTTHLPKSLMSVPDLKFLMSVPDFESPA